MELHIHLTIFKNIGDQMGLLVQWQDHDWAQNGNIHTRKYEHHLPQTGQFMTATIHVQPQWSPAAMLRVDRNR